MTHAEMAFIGFGEAAIAFAGGAPARGHDLKLADPATRPAKLAEFARVGVAPADSTAAAIAEVPLILSLVTADQALVAAEEAARGIAPGTLFCDMNSVAPDTKRAAARLIEAAGGRYVDVAVMAPVLPLRRQVPLLVAGPHAAAASMKLRNEGFVDVRVVSADIGAASAIKMIRSVMVKGLEALTAECLLAAEAAGVRGEVIASLDASETARPWAARADYHLDRMMAHGLRRAEEMAEAVKTLDALGVGATMTRSTVERQRAIGALRVSPPDGLAAKLAALAPTVATSVLGRAA